MIVQITFITIPFTCITSGVLLNNGKHIKAKRGVICNSNIWALPKLFEAEKEKLNEKQREFLCLESALKVPTKSFLHLHLGLDSTGLDRSQLQAHYTVMDKGLNTADPCGDRNMVAVSNPSMLDSSLVDQPNKIVVHAYGAGLDIYM